ncbi:MAG: IS110 family transposase [Actinomycetota bacterium]
MGFIGGVRQEEFVRQLRGKDPDRLLAVPIDVGKHSAAALVCDFWGGLVVEPFTFSLDEPGFNVFRAAVAEAEAERDAQLVRVGLEQAGHYHRTLEAKLRSDGLEVVVFNPSQVAGNRAQDPLRTLKSDVRDLGAMAELLIRRRGWLSKELDVHLVEQRALAAHRRRKRRARAVLKAQIQSTLDLVFPTLSTCLSDPLDTKLGRLVLTEGLDPGRVRRLGGQRLREYCLRRGVMVSRAKAHELVEAGRNALLLPPDVAKVHAGVLRQDVDLLARLDGEIAKVEEAMADVLAHTPAAILLSLPRVRTVRASMYGAALGDPSRFSSAAQVYRFSGLVPRLYESAGRSRSGGISREGKVELREAICELGKALRQGVPDFGAYAAALTARGKPSGIVACALGHRANRLAFALIRDQKPFSEARWNSGRARHGRSSRSTNVRRHPSASGQR